MPDTAGHRNYQVTNYQVPEQVAGDHLVRPTEGTGLAGVTWQGRGEAWPPNTGLGAKAASQHPPSADAQSPWPGNPRQGEQPAREGSEDTGEQIFSGLPPGLQG